MLTAAHQHYTAVDQIHILLALGIMAGYIAVPFTAIRRLPLTRTTQISAALFFITCALTHLSIAAGFHDNPWMVLNDLVQFVSVVVFVGALAQQVDHALRRTEERRKENKP